MANMAHENNKRLTVPELRERLKRKGICSVGKRKEELLLLVQRADGVYEDLEEDDSEQSERKRLCVRVTDGNNENEVQLRGKNVNWTDDLRDMPLVRDGNVFAYLMHQCKWGWERVNNFEKDDGYMMFKDVHVEKMRLGTITGHTHHVKVEGSVRPEQRQTDSRYATWVLLSTEAKVISGGCQCVAADDGSCKHVVCLLFTISDFCQQKRDRNPEVCTDIPMTWNKPRKESNPVRVIDLDLRQDKSLDRKSRPLPQQFQPAKTITDEDINRISTELYDLCRLKKKDALVLTLVDDPPTNMKIPTIPEIMKMFKEQPTRTDFVEYLREVITPTHRKHLQNLSQGHSEWNEARIGCITASIAGEVRSFKSSITLIQKILGRVAPFTSPAVEHGKAYENVARVQYLKQEKQHHKNLVVEDSGLFVSPELPFLGASPDGVVTCSCHPPRLLEIKSTYKFQNVTAHDIPKEDRNYHLELIDGSLKLKRASSWFLQIQFQMGVAGYKSCDFVFHTLKGISVLPVEFDVDCWEMLKSRSTSIFKNYIVPQLLDN